MMTEANKSYRKRISVWGDAEGLHLNTLIFRATTDGKVVSVESAPRAVLPPYGLVHIVDGDKELYLVAHKGAVPGLPDVWSIGVAAPVEGDIGEWIVTHDKNRRQLTD